MKITKHYFVFAVLVALAFLGKFYMLDQAKTSIDDFRGGSLKDEVWNPLFANDMNSNAFKVSIDNHEFSNATSSIYVNEVRDVMVPISILRDSMNCSVHFYDENTLLIEKRNISVQIKLGENIAECNGEKHVLSSELKQEKDEIYISLNALSEMMQYNEKFDVSDATYTVADTSESSSIVPSRYDLREKYRVSEVKNQGIYGTCWAFATATALESSVLPERTGALAIDHMVLANGLKGDFYKEGSQSISMAYLAAWMGPVYEKDDAYGDEETDKSLTPVYHVQEMKKIGVKDYDTIKEAVFKYGGVQTSIYNTIKATQGSTRYFNKEKSAYCYIGTEKPNHDVVIIGWDDNYSRKNFNIELEGDGAFICQNSWGSRFGEDGVFYISYYDTNVGSNNLCFSRVESAENYDHIYQSDLGGMVGSLGFTDESAYGANVFTAKGNEEIKAAAFYATGDQTEYEVFVVKDFVDTSSFSMGVKVANGIIEKAGYYTIDFTRAIQVKAGERFAIVVHLTTPGSEHPLAIEFRGKQDFYKNVDLSDGEGYISVNGRKFTDVKDVKNCNLCIKAFSNSRK